jgi:hypothetical protein
MSAEEQGPLPMVNDGNIKNFVNRWVILHGKVASLKNGNLFLSVNPEKNTDIIVKSFNDMSVKQGDTLKIIGKVYHDLSLELSSFYKLSEDFDLKLLNEMLPIIHHKEVQGMFY